MISDKKEQLKEKIEFKEDMLIINDEELLKDIKKDIRSISNYVKKKIKIINNKLNNQTDVKFIIQFVKKPN